MKTSQNPFLNFSITAHKSFLKQIFAPPPLKNPAHAYDLNLRINLEMNYILSTEINLRLSEMKITEPGSPH